MLSFCIQGYRKFIFALSEMRLGTKVVTNVLDTTKKTDPSYLEAFSGSELVKDRLLLHFNILTFELRKKFILELCAMKLAPRLVQQVQSAQSS